MKEKTNPIGTTRLLWSFALGLGLMVGVLLTLMPHAAVEAQDVNPGFTVDLARNAVWGLVSPGDTIAISSTTGDSGRSPT